ncbi:hypothetical protein [Citrobacter sp. MNAZ 1397]|uniref:hypothetical protein n=1 Tax=Citrobacter sp. MNAZ 1397 TaxID=2911205 RepID=UPI002025FEFB|nr:hypothetical protein [Citrobacter sp. MNAZ 1397]MCL9673967.1 hypothetical protein [Citrobacter sp. MNAZ 1397]
MALLCAKAIAATYAAPMADDRSQQTLAFVQILCVPEAEVVTTVCLSQWGAGQYWRIKQKIPWEDLLWGRKVVYSAATA